MSAAPAVLLALVAALAAAPARAEPPPDGPACADDVQARLTFLEQRLDERRIWADRWWKAWTVTYGIGTAVQSVRAGIEDDDGEQADFTVSAVKALFGTARLLWSPPTARKGADPMRAIAANDAAGCAARLAAGEALLRESARESESRWSWKRHLSNVAINVAGGVIVAEGFDESKGWTSAGVGIAVGEAMTWSHPWHADDDLAEYERRFELARGPRPSWHVAPWGRGVRVGLRF
jgi:hypothetical protein